MSDDLLEALLEQGAAEVEEEPIPNTPEAMALRSAIVAALDELVKAEQVEIEDEKAALVADELLLAGLEAHNPRHALKKLRLALIHSDNVEEVYAADLALEDAFRRAMGG